MLTSFCGILTLQVGTAILAAVFFTISAVVLAQTGFNFYNDPTNDFPFPLVVVVVFAVLTILAGIIMFMAAYNESRGQCILAVVVLVIALVYWIILSCLSFANDPTFLRKICIDERCAETFWLVNLQYRGNWRGVAQQTEETSSIVPPAGNETSPDKTPDKTPEDSGGQPDSAGKEGEDDKEGEDGKGDGEEEKKEGAGDGEAAKEEGDGNPPAGDGEAAKKEGEDAPPAAEGAAGGGEAAKKEGEDAPPAAEGAAGGGAAPPAAEGAAPPGNRKRSIEDNVHNKKKRQVTYNENSYYPLNVINNVMKEFCSTGNMKKHNINKRDDSEYNEAPTDTEADIEGSTSMDGETKYDFGIPMVGAIVLFVLNFVFFLFAILIMWSYAQELKWADYYEDD